MSVAIRKPHQPSYTAPGHDFAPLTFLTSAATDRERVEWLFEVPWQVTATLTFPRIVAASTADAAWKTFIDRLEASQHSRIGIVYGRELHSKHGGRVNPHFHALIAAPNPIRTMSVAQTWREVVGARQDDDSAVVDLYDGNLAGISYCLKMADGQRGEWGVHNLQHFHSGAGSSVPITPASNARSRRSARRWANFDPSGTQAIHAAA